MDSLSQVEAIFFATLEKRSAEDRAHCLDELCGGDSALRGRVERLLNAYPRIGKFLDQPLVDPPPYNEGDLPNLVEPTRTSATEGPGACVGPYKLLEQIGEGGFGIVYMAEQQQPVRRKVAVKILKPGMDTRQVVARFEAERQALAVMDHPNIARVLDGGTTESGRPYFAMDLVRGLPITEFCDKQQLELRERLALFVSVCQAVQHAHTKGIIHRDLKPSNVMVTLHDGVPLAKIIDFGIAKALGQQLTEKTLFTGFVQMVGTPIYMSPEQAELGSHDVDTRADIYSLGVLLYEMLTGTTPFDPGRLRQVGYEEMRRIIRDEDPPRPSTRFTPGRASETTLGGLRGEDSRKLGQLFRGELDWIVMKSLDKDRNRRYETASALATDVTRYLNDESVVACPPSAIYRFKKFARRNRTALTMAAVVAVAILAVVAVTAGSIGWASADRAARDATLDREVGRTIDEAATRIDAAQWNEAAATLERANKLLLAAGRARSPRLVELQRDVEMAQRLEAIYTRPPNHDFFTGKEQDAAYARAFRDYGIDVQSLDTEEAAARIRASRLRTELARSIDYWASMRRMSGNRGPPDWKQLLQVGTLADADPWRNRVREALVREDYSALATLARDAEVAKFPAVTLELLGRWLGETDYTAEAVELLRRAQRQYPDDLWINDSLAWYCLTRTRELDDALRFYTAARAVRPHSPFLTKAVADALIAKGAYAAALPYLTESLRLRPDYIEAFIARADAYSALGQVGKALADYSRAIEASPGRAEIWHARARTYCKLGFSKAARDDATRAIELNGQFAGAWSTRATAHNQLGQWGEALADCRRAVEIDPQCGEGWNNHAWALVTATDPKYRDPDRAIELAKHAVLLDPEDGNFWNTLAVAHFRAGDLPAAVAALDKAMQIHHGGDAVDWVFAAMIAERRNEREAALCWFDEAVNRYQTKARHDEELWRSCTEAAGLLGVESPPPPDLFGLQKLFTVAPALGDEK